MRGKLKKKQIKVIPEEHLEKKPKKRVREIWDDVEDNELIKIVTQELKNRMKIRRKTYYNLANKFDKKVSAIKKRVYYHKQKGSLPKMLSPETREKMTRNMRKLQQDKKIKKKDEDSGYMKSRTPTMPKPKSLFGQAKEFIPLFSKSITPDQNELLKSMIQNDIKNNGVSKITLEKLSYIMSIDKGNYENLLLDITKNTRRIKDKLEIGVINIQNQGNENFIIFS